MHRRVTLLLGLRKGLSFPAGLEDDAREMARVGSRGQILPARNSCSLLVFWCPEPLPAPCENREEGLGVGSNPRLIQTQETVS